MRAVSDSSVLIVYARSGLIDLLNRVFDEVIAPAAVHYEVSDAQHELTDARVIAGLTWLRRVEVEEVTTPPGFPSWFGKGEAAVLLAAMAMSEPVTLLIDDGGARRHLRQPADDRRDAASGRRIARSTRPRTRDRRGDDCPRHGSRG